MMLLSPWALWFMLAGAGVIALYLLKIKRRRAVVPALDFWLQLAGRTKVHSLFERLKRVLSLLLWLLIVTCLVLALGNPIFSLGRIKPRAIAIVLDNSASMQTIEEDAAGVGGGGALATRLALAQQAVAELTTRRPVSDEWLLIEAGREPRVLHPWTRDGKSIRRAAESTSPFGGSSDVAAAVELASQLLAGKGESTIVVISDGAAGKVESLAKDDEQLVPWPIGTTTDNVGITRLAVRPHRQHSNHHALITLVNASSERIDTQLTLEIDGVAGSVELVGIEPGGTWEKTVIIEAPEGGVLRAVLDRPDALPLDNEAFAVLQPIRPAVVWLVTPSDEAFFFEQALAAMDPLIWAEESLTLPPAQFEAALAATTSTADSAATLRPPDLVIFNNAAPAALPPGRFILINAWADHLPLRPAGVIASPQLFLSPRPHALTQHLTLQGVRLAKAQRITFLEPAQVLAHSADGDPLIFLLEQPDRQALCLAFDVLESDLPFRNAFPLLLRNAVAFLHDEAPPLIPVEHAAGELIRPTRPLPSGTTELSMRPLGSVSTEQRLLPVTDGRFAVPAPDRPAALRFTAGGETWHTAINIADPDESRIAPIAAADPRETLGLSETLFGTLPWIALAAAAAMLISLEWLTYHFRWTE